MKAQSGLHFWNFGIGGTSPRDWYYILRDADPERHRFAAIVLSLDRYADRDSGDNLADRPLDENYVIGRLRLADCWEFSQSFSVSQLRYSALSGCILKGITLRRDVLEFLPNFSDRVKRSRDWRDHGLDYINGYGGKPGDLEGLSVDWMHHSISFPPGVTEAQRYLLQAALMPSPFPQTGRLTRYRQYWLGKILRLYTGSPTRIIFVQYPTGPLPVTNDGTPKTFIDWALAGC
jgi:hypothetical protein